MIASKELAKKLYEVGFNLPCLGYYRQDPDDLELNYTDHKITLETSRWKHIYLAPDLLTALHWIYQHLNISDDKRYLDIKETFLVCESKLNLQLLQLLQSN